MVSLISNHRLSNYCINDDDNATPEANRSDLASHHTWKFLVYTLHFLIAQYSSSSIMPVFILVSHRSTPHHEQVSSSADGYAKQNVMFSAKTKKSFLYKLHTNIVYHYKWRHF